jgi:hypothetical protein
LQTELLIDHQLNFAASPPPLHHSFSMLGTTDTPPSRLSSSPTIPEAQFLENVKVRHTQQQQQQQHDLSPIESSTSEDDDIDFPFSNMEIIPYNLDNSHLPRSKNVPHLYPEIWSIILSMACTSLHKLHTASMISKSIRRYCWDSPASKARFLVRRHTAQHAVKVSALTNCMRFPDYPEILKWLTDRYSGVSCEPEDASCSKCPVYKITFTHTKHNKAELVRAINASFPCLDDDHFIPAIEEAIRLGDLDLMYGLLRIDPKVLEDMTDEEKRTRIGQGVYLEESDYRAIIEGKHYHMEFLCDSSRVEEAVDMMIECVNAGFVSFAKMMMDDPDLDTSTLALWRSVDFHKKEVVDNMVKLGYDLRRPVELLCGYPQTDNGLGAESKLWNRLKSYNLPKRTKGPCNMSEKEPEAYATLQYVCSIGGRASSAALAHAAILGYSDVVDILLKKGAHINTECIHAAFFAGQYEILDYLLEMTAKRHNKDVKDFKCDCPISSKYDLPAPRLDQFDDYLTNARKLINMRVYHDVWFWENLLTVSLADDLPFDKVKQLVDAGALVTLAALLSTENICLDNFRYLMDSAWPLSPSNLALILRKVMGWKDWDRARLLICEYGAVVDWRVLVLSSMVWVSGSGLVYSESELDEDYVEQLDANCEFFEFALSVYSGDPKSEDKVIERVLNEYESFVSLTRYRDLGKFAEVLITLTERGFPVTQEAINVTTEHYDWETIEDVLVIASLEQLESKVDPNVEEADSGDGEVDDEEFLEINWDNMVGPAAEDVESGHSVHASI